VSISPTLLSGAKTPPQTIEVCWTLHTRQVRPLNTPQVCPRICIGDTPDVIGVDSPSPFFSLLHHHNKKGNRTVDTVRLGKTRPLFDLLLPLQYLSKVYCGVSQITQAWSMQPTCLVGVAIVLWVGLQLHTTGNGLGNSRFIFFWKNTRHKTHETDS